MQLAGLLSTAFAVITTSCRYLAPTPTLQWPSTIVATQQMALSGPQPLPATRLQRRGTIAALLQIRAPQATSPLLPQREADLHNSTHLRREYLEITCFTTARCITRDYVGFGVDHSA